MFHRDVYIFSKGWKGKGRIGVSIEHELQSGKVKKNRVLNLYLKCLPSTWKKAKNYVEPEGKKISKKNIIIIQKYGKNNSTVMVTH